MELSDDIVAAINSLCDEWNRAEKAIKIAEQINGEIINPSIYELRYGGRRIVEAFTYLKDGDEEKALCVLRDAEFDCCRARHDSIDAATSKVASDLDIAQNKLGVDVVVTAFPDFPLLIADLGEVRDKIAESRENRDDRNLIYATIQRDNLEEIARKYHAFRANESVMKQYAKKQRAEKTFHRLTTFASIIIAAAALFYAIYHDNNIQSPQARTPAMQQPAKSGN